VGIPHDARPHPMPSCRNRRPGSLPFPASDRARIMRRPP
jgi:hypothetical protein